MLWLPEKTSAAPTEGSLPHAGGIVLGCRWILAGMLGGDLLKIDLISKLLPDLWPQLDSTLSTARQIESLS